LANEFESISEYDINSVKGVAAEPLKARFALRANIVCQIRQGNETGNVTRKL
jgi:hypothetical protein